MLFSLVKKHGMADTRIIVTGARPARVAVPAREPATTRQALPFGSLREDGSGIDYARQRWENTR